MLRMNEKLVMDFILKFWKQNQYAPTIREIAEGIGKQTRSVQRTIPMLADRGYIKFLPKQARTIVPKGMILDFSEVDAYVDNVLEVPPNEEV